VPKYCSEQGRRAGGGAPRPSLKQFPIRALINKCSPFKQASGQPVKRRHLICFHPKGRQTKKATRRLLEINEIKEIPELILATVMSK